MIWGVGGIVFLQRTQTFANNLIMQGCQTSAAEGNPFIRGLPSLRASISTALVRMLRAFVPFVLPTSETNGPICSPSRQPSVGLSPSLGGTAPRAAPLRSDPCEVWGAAPPQRLPGAAALLADGTRSRGGWPGRAERNQRRPPNETASGKAGRSGDKKRFILQSEALGVLL